MTDAPTISKQDNLGRHDRLIQELDHDPYHSKLKLQEGTTCSECSATYHKGRWTWESAASDAPQKLCPACQRIQDKVPAAFLTISGDFFSENKQEILNMIHNTEDKEKQSHPLKRIMAIDEQDGQTEVTFTDAHLASAIGHALESAYQGDLDLQYTKGDIMLRVTWNR